MYIYIYIYSYIAIPIALLCVYIYIYIHPERPTVTLAWSPARPRGILENNVLLFDVTYGQPICVASQ